MDCSFFSISTLQNWHCWVNWIFVVNLYCELIMSLLCESGNHMCWQCWLNIGLLICDVVWCHAMSHVIWYVMWCWCNMQGIRSLYHYPNRRSLSLSHHSLGWLYVFSPFPPCPRPRPRPQKPFELNLWYLAQRIYGSGEMYRMTLLQNIAALLP